jgi:hypothetical protein
MSYSDLCIRWQGLTPLQRKVARFCLFQSANGVGACDVDSDLMLDVHGAFASVLPMIVPNIHGRERLNFQLVLDHLGLPVGFPIPMIPTEQADQLPISGPRCMLRPMGMCLLLLRPLCRLVFQWLLSLRGSAPLGTSLLGLWVSNA